MAETPWWHCSSCGYEVQVKMEPRSCILCKQHETFKQGKRERKHVPSVYDDVVKELEKYEEGCDPLTTKSGYAE